MTDLRPIYFREARERLIGNRQIVHDALLRHGPCTGSELGARMGWGVLSVRPRLTELRAIGAAVQTGNRRDGEHEFRALTLAEMEANINAHRNELAERAAVCAPAVQQELFA